METPSKKVEIDSIFNEIGEFGRFQIYILLTIGYIKFLCTPIQLNYVLSTDDADYRCRVPQCEPTNESQYDQVWISLAIPMIDGKPSQCYRYGRARNATQNNRCSPKLFNRSEEVRCDQFVFKSDEVGFINDFQLFCDENKWKLSSVGSVRGIGCLLNNLVFGGMSDKYGRKICLIASTIFAVAFGVIKTFATGYNFYIVLEFLDALLGNGIYICGFTMVMEMLTTKYRDFGGVVCFIVAPLSKIVLGLLAMWLLDWKWVIRCIVIACLPILVYYWILPESVSWLLAKGRYTDATDIFLRAAKMNGKELSPETLDLLKNRPQDICVAKSDPKKGCTLLEAFRYPTFILRVIISSYCLFTVIFVNIGMVNFSTEIDGNKYLNFIWLAVVEIPAQILCILISKRIGRKKLLCSTYFVSAASSFACVFLNGHHTLEFTSFLVGKFAITMTFVVTLTYMSEIFPTEFRQSLIGVSLASGSVGGMLAPQVRLISSYWDVLPYVLFGVTSIIAAVLCLILPETLGKNLPNSIDDALQLNDKVVVSNM